MERQVYYTLERDGRISKSSLQRLFKHYLKNTPVIEIRSKLYQNEIIISPKFGRFDFFVILDYNIIHYVSSKNSNSKRKYFRIEVDFKEIKQFDYPENTYAYRN